MDEPLKQRLVGALVVGTFVIVVVPLLLGEPEAPPVKRPLASASPSPANPMLTPPPLPQPVREVREPLVETPHASVMRAPNAGPDKVKAAAQSAVAPHFAVASPLLGAAGWQVQAATLSSASSAARLVQRLRGAGLDARAEQRGRFWRVYVVGFETREDADGARARLQLEFSLSGVIQTSSP
jgi:DedD protein